MSNKHAQKDEQTELLITTNRGQMSVAELMHHFKPHIVEATSLHKNNELFKNALVCNKSNRHPSRRAKSEMHNTPAQELPKRNIARRAKSGLYDDQTEHSLVLLNLSDQERDEIS